LRHSKLHIAADRGTIRNPGATDATAPQRREAPWQEIVAADPKPSASSLLIVETLTPPLSSL
jgi:hypothetical protein